MTSVHIAEPSISAGPPLDVALVGCVDDHRRAEDLAGLAAALGARGHAVTVYTRRQGRQTAPFRDAVSYRVRDIRLGAPRPLSDGDALALSGELAGHLDDAWRRSPPDVVHAYGWLPGVAAQLAARRQLLPTVQSFDSLASPRDANT
ncbi:hypothetical protein C6A85_000000108235, partial [Mycobacterium sp. ITM-2017-0098]